MKKLSLTIFIFSFALISLQMECEGFQPKQLSTGAWKADLSSFFSTPPNDISVQFDRNRSFNFSNLQKENTIQYKTISMDMGAVNTEKSAVIGGIGYRIVGVEDVDSMSIVSVPQDADFKEFIPVYVRSTNNQNEMIRGVFIPERSLDINSENGDGNGGITISLSDGTTIIVNQSGATHYLIDSFYGDQNFYKTTATN